MKSELEIVKDKQAEFSDLYKRMDADRDLRNLEKYKMKTLDNKADMPGVSNVTLPEPALFISKTIAKIAGVLRQPVVEADANSMKDSDTSIIEHFIEDMEYEIDAYLNQRGEVPAFNFHADIACSRGRVAEQVLTRIEGGVYIPDVRQLDTRYFTYELGSKGMIWGAVESERGNEDINEEYPGAVKETGKSKVNDIYNKKEHIVYVAEKEIKRDPNPYKKPPFILQVVPAGSVLKDKDNLKNTGESVYETLRHIFPEQNFIATTLKTQSYGVFTPPLQFPTKEGVGATPPTDSPAKPGGVTMTEIGAPIQPVFTPDIKASTRLYHQIITAEAEKAGYSSIDFGQLSWPLSAVAMARLAQGKVELLLPRLQALALLYQARYKMIIEQFLAIGKTLELGELGHRRTYEPSKLEGKYTIKFRFFTTSKEEQASDAAIANAMRPFVSDDYIAREVFKLPNPDGDMMQRESEQVDDMFPILKLFKQCHSLIGKDRDLEIEYLKRKIKALYLQEMMPTPVGKGQAEPKTPERPEGKQLMELFAGGGGRPPTEEE